MAFRLTRFKSLLLGLITASVLSAQVDPRLVTDTDLLDVYKKGGTKPEILTLFDFSGSMHAMYWHPSFWTSAAQNSHGSPWGTDDFPGVIPVLDAYGHVFMYRGTGYYQSLYTGSQISNFDPSGGRLVSPDGNLIPLSGTALGQAGLAAIVKQASHIRIKVTAASIKIGSTTYNNVTRQVDLPIPWAVFQTISSSNASSIKQLVADPSGGPAMDADRLYLTAPNDLNIVNDDFGYGYKIGRFHYNYDYLWWIFFGADQRNADGSGSTDTGKFIVPAISSTAPLALEPNTPGVANASWSNGIPGLTRFQGLKFAVLSAWFANQTKALWAFRYLDGSEEGGNNISSNNGNSNAGGVSRDLRLFGVAANSTTPNPQVKTFLEQEPQTSTPLTYAAANCYAQMVSNDDLNSIFHATTADPFTPCRTSWVVLFTDGNANDSTPGGGIGALGTNLTTEALIQGIPLSNLNPSNTPTSSNFNIWSLAGVAAHGVTRAGQTLSSSGATPSAFAPFRVTSRGSTVASPRVIQTMTVGLSLGGTVLDVTGGKGPLVLAALYGDPATKTYDPPNAVAYGVNVSGKTPVNFFDAASHAALAQSITDILNRATKADTSITAPAAPLVGLNLGNRAYLGRFATDVKSGSVWAGDLLMAGLGIQPDGTVGLKDKAGVFQVDINAGNAVASASSIFIDPGTKLTVKSWKARNVYTMIPGTAMPATGLDLTASAQAFSDQNLALAKAKVMGTADDASAISLIRFIRGASSDAQKDAASSTTITTNRPDIMGDIINSSPAAVEYDPSLMSTVPFTGTYTGFTDIRYQVIFVGDNQGHFHAFGEKSGIDSTGVLHGELIELWSFVPPELLNDPSVSTTVPKLSKLQASGNSHIYTVDGSPYIYFKDTPVTGSTSGNHRVDSTDTIRVIFGMRKGGRSYYALDVVNPVAPKLAWMLDPADTTITPFLFKTAVQYMGLATSTPSIARVEMGNPAVTKDVVFIGGGYSNNKLDTPPSLPTPPIAPGGGPLGRSLLALDVLDGTPVKVYDFRLAPLAGKFPNMGAISTGAFPFEFYVGSRKAQRVYFGDHSGGVYALGSMETMPTSPVGWRVDSSNIDKWTLGGVEDTGVVPAFPGIRWIYKGQTTLTGGSVTTVTAAAPISSTPVAYRLPKAIPQFRRPSTSTNAPNMTPPVVGVAFGTGDRNDPMDLDPINPVANAPYRQIMVFDRQDSADLPTVGGLPSNVDGAASAITDAQLSDQTATALTGDTSYLGNNQFLGYYLKFHPPTTDPISGKPLFEKAFLNSMVINGALIFSAFKPGKTGSTVICEGAGVTHTWRMCDALAPVFGSGDLATTGTTIDKQLAGCNGFVFTWTNLAGDLTAIGSRMVLQSGQDTPSGTTTSGNVKIQDLVVPSGTLSFAPRAWRVIR